MNREVYQDIYQELCDQKKTFERIGQIIEKIPTEEMQMNLEKIEAALEFFIQRMLFAFRNDYINIRNEFRKLLERAKRWEELEKAAAIGEQSGFLEEYFRDITHLLDNIIEIAENSPKNDDRMGLVLIVKNEARFLPEWIEYHKAVGISRFFIYDNDSTDNIKEVLKPYIEEGSVTYTWCPGKQRQFPAYTDALDRFRFEVKYMGFIDTDEFILPVQGDNVPDIVQALFEKNPNAGGIAASWRIFGSNGKIKDDGKPVIESFTRRAENSFWQHQHIKSICDPRKTLYPMSAHHFFFTEGFNTVNERGAVISGPYDFSGENYDCAFLQVNHYYVKTREYWDRVKMKRGFADIAGNYEDSYFLINDRNEVEDTRILKFLPEVKKNLRERGFLNE